jgi:hypothetical protein
VQNKNGGFAAATAGFPAEKQAVACNAACSEGCALQANWLKGWLKGLYALCWVASPNSLKFILKGGKEVVDLTSFFGWFFQQKSPKAGG